MPTKKYWQNLGIFMGNAKDNIPKQFRIGDTSFTSLTTIGGNLRTRHPKNCTHVQKDSYDLLSVIFVLATGAHGYETVFNME